MTAGGRPAGCREGLRFDGRVGLVLPDQIRALDKIGLVKRMGRVDDKTSRATLSILRDIFEE